MNAEKRIETLTRLGLTLDQARTYLALLQMGQATAKELAEQSKIDRSDMYRIIPTLQKEGLVEKLITRPASFKAASSEQALPFLLKRKNDEQNELNNETNVLICDLANCQEESKEIDKETNFIIVPGKEMIVQKMKDSLLKAKISLSVVTSQKRFSSAIIEFSSGYHQALKRGVKIKIATDRHIAQKEALSMVKNLSLDTNFEIRYFDVPPMAIVVIFDNKEVYVTLSAKAQLTESSAIWSDNPSFLELAQTYFEKKWDNSLL